ncbi:MAG: NADH-quinone oxidoreductase subunit C, partial [Chloroflexota bacterium]|nr:NADH-quinone oxidoreductase subunit C [Chloroflexota bacterium]
MAVTEPVAPPVAKPVSANDPQSIADQIKARFPDAVDSVSAQGLVIQSARLIDVARFLKGAPGLSYDYLNNVTSVDWPDRLEVVYHLSSITRGGAPLTLKVNAKRDDPVVPSLVPVYRGADFQEREVYDMMGVRFSGHPNLRRILMWEGFAGHPLRKDYHEPYYEEEHKPFGTRWDQGHHVIA